MIGDRLTKSDGRALVVREIETFAGRLYVRTKRLNVELKLVGEKIGGGEVIRPLGHRMTGDPPKPTIARYMLCRCEHGTEGPKSESSIYAVVRGEPGFTSLCFASCRRLRAAENQPDCLWCGTTRADRFGGSKKSECDACNRAATRNDRFLCGKPRRAYVLVKPEREHSCRRCKRWARR